MLTGYVWYNESSGGEGELEQPLRDVEVAIA